MMYMCHCFQISTKFFMRFEGFSSKQRIFEKACEISVQFSLFRTRFRHIHTAPFLFLSVFVAENAARSHCSVFKKQAMKSIRVHIAPAKLCC